MGEVQTVEDILKIARLYLSWIDMNDYSSVLLQREGRKIPRQLWDSGRCLADVLPAVFPDSLIAGFCPLHLWILSPELGHDSDLLWGLVRIEPQTHGTCTT